jgi:hypothetical protein
MGKNNTFSQPEKGIPVEILENIFLLVRVRQRRFLLVKDRGEQIGDRKKSTGKRQVSTLSAIKLKDKVMNIFLEWVA